LYSQLGYDMVSICTKAGATLEDTYRALTGTSGGYMAFTQFLQSYFPPGKTPPLATDNPFPLRQGASRTVNLTFTQESSGAMSLAQEGEAHARPYVNCPVGTYGYTIFNTPKRLHCRATVEGFGQPVYRWKVNGHELERSSSNITATVQTDNPDNRNRPSSSNEVVQFQYSPSWPTSTYAQMSEELHLTCLGTPGHILLSIEVEVSERHASSDASARSSLATLDTQVLVYDPAYYADREDCKVALRELLDHLTQYTWIPIVLTLPDPPHELERAMSVVQQLGEELQRLAQEEPRIAEEVRTHIQSLLGVTGELLAAPPQ
jgi:hypothetical protein